MMRGARPRKHGRSAGVALEAHNQKTAAAMIQKAHNL
jgi:hypothetical protein